MSLSIKFTLFTSTLCILIIAAICFLAYQNAYHNVEVSVGERLEAIAATGAIGISGDLHDQVLVKGDETTEAFLSIREHLLAIKERNNLSQEVYTFRRVGEELEFVVMTNEKPFIGDTYSIREEMWPTLNEGRTAHTGVYRDAHGSWMSAYAPVLDSQGHFSGLLEVDIHVDEFLELTRRQFRILLVKGAAFAVLAVILSFFLAKTVTRRIVHLTEVTEKISLGRMDAPIRIKGSDEVAKLGRALDRMRESIKIASELID